MRSRRPRRSSRRASWSSRSRCWWCSTPTARPRTPRCRSISTPRRCRSCSCLRARASSPIPRTSTGPWAGCRPTTARPARMRITSCSIDPNAKIAVLYQNDDFGKDYLNGLHDGLGDKAKKLIVAEASFELSDPTVDSQMVSLKASGADTFFNIATAKFAAQAIRKAYDIGWKPLQFVSLVGSSVGQVMTPGGSRESGRRDHRRLRQGSDRSAMGQGSGDEGMARLHEEVLSERRSHRLVQRLRVRRRADAGAGAEAVRRRSHARERHGAGGEPEELQSAAAAARYHASTPVPPTIA